MIARNFLFCCSGLLLLGGLFSTAAAQSKTLPSIADRTRGMRAESGFLPFFHDQVAGRIYWRIDRFEEDMLLQSSARTGLGSNPIGIDRSQLGRTRVVRFRRVGRKVLLIERNLKFRATRGNEDEKRAVRESFPESVLHGWMAEASSGQAALIDATPFLLSDRLDVAGRLRSAGAGTYTLDESRSVPHTASTRAFPDNCEFEALVTFKSSKPGSEISRTAVDPKSISLRQHFSFIRLPDGKFAPRAWDGRSGYFSRRHMDFSAPLGQSVHAAYLTRHRLIKNDPIVYYVDPAIPEPVRAAVIEGASWWKAAFEAAGFANAFEVKVLPKGADPLDVRFNVIQWVHRATRGWSFGSTVVDPRTGEIIKGHVLLGSLRVRHDQLMYAGLEAEYGNGDGCSCGAGAGPAGEALAFLDANTDREQVALARMRQLAAHEVGHTLGLAHNFAASTHDRASVMDYPAPLVKIKDGGQLDLSDAYAVGIGEWDRLAIRFGYTQFGSQAEGKQGLRAIVAEGIQAGLRYLSDADARSPGCSDPAGNLWDNGDDPVAGLWHALKVRRAALDGFGENNIPEGAPLSTLERLLVPLYLHHRYAVDAAAKALGGASYDHAHRGDGRVPVRVVDSGRQRAALDVLLKTLHPSELALNEKTLALFAPPSEGRGRNPDAFTNRTGPTFDLMSAATAAANLTVPRILNSQRLTRMVEWSARHAAMPDVDEVVERLTTETFAESWADSTQAAVARAVQRVVVSRLLELAVDRGASFEVRAVTRHGLRKLAKTLGERSPDRNAHEGALLAEIDSFLKRPYVSRKRGTPGTVPAGSPIGR